MSAPSLSPCHICCCRCSFLQVLAKYIYIIYTEYVLCLYACIARDSNGGRISGIICSIGEKSHAQNILCMYWSCIYMLWLLTRFWCLYNTKKCPPAILTFNTTYFILCVFAYARDVDFELMFSMLHFRNIESKARLSGLFGGYYPQMIKFYQISKNIE